MLFYINCEFIQKSRNHYELQTRNKGKFGPVGSKYKIEKIFKGIASCLSEEEKKEIADCIKRCKTPYETENGYLFYYEGDRFDKDKLEKCKKKNPKQYTSYMEEIKHASALANLGIPVYLPLEDHSEHKKHFDAIIHGIKVEFKYLETNSYNTIQKRLRNGLDQAANISLYVPKGKEISNLSIINAIKGEINATKKKSNVVDVYFEENNSIEIIDTNDIKIKKSVFNKYALKLDEIGIPPFDAFAKVKSLAEFNKSFLKKSLAIDLSLLSIISDDEKKSMNSFNKSLTYSGHKLQGRTKFAGMNISIENKKGSYRSGVDKDGHKWRCYMNYDYGYIRGTEGVDGDHVDCYIGDNDNAENVYVIHQNDPVTHKYDEDKCMLGFDNSDEAKKAYLKQYDRPGFFGSIEKLTMDQFKSYVFSHLGQRIHKSFEIEIKNITEGNKNQKVDQVSKALNNLYHGKTFVLNSIPADNTRRVNDVVMKIKNFDTDKINKAVRTLSFSLDTPLKAVKGEAFLYKAQEDLTNRFIQELTDKTKAVYTFVLDYFGLPEIRVIQKANLVHKGQILYDPESGKPITTDQWDKFVKALDAFLNRNYSGVGERIILTSEALGRILDRMLQYNTLEAITKMSVEDVEFHGRSLDWISDSVKNMKDVFGDPFDRWQQARIEVLSQSGAQRIKSVTDKMRNDIQQVLIDGVKNKQSKNIISQTLFDKCVGLNRDFQKIADSEIQSAVNDAYIQEEIHNTPEGEKVYFKRFEILDDNTCKKCQEMRGKIILWSEFPLQSSKIKDDYADLAMWEGSGILNKNDVPTTIFHPYCRGGWYRYYPESEKIVNALAAADQGKTKQWNDAIFKVKVEDTSKDETKTIEKVQNELNKE